MPETNDSMIPHRRQLSGQGFKQDRGTLRVQSKRRSRLSLTPPPLPTPNTVSFPKGWLVHDLVRDCMLRTVALSGLLHHP